MTHFELTHATNRFQGIRWKIHAGTYQGIQEFSVNETQRFLQSFVPYTIEIKIAHAGETIEEAADGGHLIILGTPDDNPLIKPILKSKKINLPENKEGYILSSNEAPWNPKQRIILIAGLNPVGVLYGVQDFNTRILGVEAIRSDPLDISLPEKFPSFLYIETPVIANRGIWTWGYVIYDYKNFLDNMARLRMNLLTIWNDKPPLNIEKVIDYAHDRGIRIVLGFPWGWGKKLNLANPEDQQKLKAEVLCTYEKEYSHLKHDGIYFQTLTETNDRTINSKPIALVTCELVNDISADLLQRFPALEIQFGLHATSIMDDYPMLKSLDNRVTITWEDAGTLPYSYDPRSLNDSPENTVGFSSINNAEKTISYSRNLAGLRKDCCFAMVAKGFSEIRWRSEFEHHRTFILGERSQNFMDLRLKKNQTSWDKKNALWFAHFQDAIKFYKAILEVNPNGMNVTALVEDGLFERQIQPCVSLFSLILWNPNSEIMDIMIQANSAFLKGSI